MSDNPKGAGRNPLEDDDRKSENIRIRLSKKELAIIKSLHDRNNLKNTSVLVREILLKESIHVKILNNDFISSLRKLEDMKEQMRKVLRTKTPKFEEFKPVAEQLMTILMDTYSQMNNITLSLPDLREYEQWDPHTKEWYSRYSSFKQMTDD